MIEVFHADGKWFGYEKGESTMTDENGWIYVIDADGLTIAAHPRDKIDRVRIVSQAGESREVLDNSKDGN